MNELIVFGYDLLTSGAATLSVSVAGLAVALTVTIKSRNKLKKFFATTWRSIKSIF